MYTMFAGFLHGAAMAGSAGMSATDFAARATPFLSAMTFGFADDARVIDGGDYTVAGQQSLDFSDLSHIVRASEEQGVEPSPIAAVQELISKQIAAGPRHRGLRQDLREPPGRPHGPHGQHRPHRQHTQHRPHGGPPMNAPVTLIGLGPMGQAMVHTLLRAGHPVTVWNRTPSRADDVVAAGATLAATPADALAASELVILSLTDYQAMYDILGPATEALAGRTLVNLSSDSPDRTREGAVWAEKHGARFLTGGVMTPAPMVGTEAAYVYYSGPTERWRPTGRRSRRSVRRATSGRTRAWRSSCTWPTSTCS